MDSPLIRDSLDVQALREMFVGQLILIEHSDNFFSVVCDCSGQCTDITVDGTTLHFELDNGRRNLGIIFLQQTDGCIMGYNADWTRGLRRVRLIDIQVLRKTFVGQPVIIDYARAFRPDCLDCSGQCTDITVDGNAVRFELDNGRHVRTLSFLEWTERKIYAQHREAGFRNVRLAT